MTPQSFLPTHTQNSADNAGRFLLLLLAYCVDVDRATLPVTLVVTVLPLFQVADCVLLPCLLPRWGICVHSTLLG